MRRFFLLCFLGCIFSISLFAKLKITKPTAEKSSAFAIVVDKATYGRIESSIDEYRDAIQEEDNLSVYIITVDNDTPDVIKEELLKLYKSSQKIEGAVFIGDIPIPMLRGAQHMASAFKMNEERYDWSESSIPSDRYYDDFDLKFTFLKQDSSNALYYYYRLLPDSPQKVQKEIYTGRIKAPVDGDSKYDMIAAYLAKAVAAKKNPETLNNAMVFTGHGYHSEALAAWDDESVALREQFPDFYKAGGRIKNIRFSMSGEMKNVLMTELSRKDLDMAIFHAHGAEDTQYLIGYPEAGSIEANVTEGERFLRSKLRYYKKRGKDLEEVKTYYKDKYHVTEDWFEGAFVDSVIKADSLFDYKMDMHSEDLDLFSPQPEFVMFDECFNGSFHKENYIAGKYVFGSGNVIVGIANSVNVLQDKWADKSLGLLAYGVSVGNWHREINYLENHIIGDPTFHFKKTGDIDLNEKIACEGGNEEFWRGLLNSKEPELRSIAIVKLFKILGDDFIPDLVEIYKTDESFNVRTHAFYSLAATDSKEFRDILSISITDPYEFIRRVSAEIMGETGDSRYIPEMINAMIYDESKRVTFNTASALQFVDQDKMLEDAGEIVSATPDFVNKESLLRIFERIAAKSKAWVNEDILPSLKNDSLKISKRINSVRTLRNYKFKVAIPEVLTMIKDKSVPVELRVALVEAMGWYNYNELRFKMIDVMNDIVSDKEAPKSLSDEALKTKNRLLEGCNVPVTP